jgi:ABC-type dipeptide/oligopeptide/nickel transport system permease subunit
MASLAHTRTELNEKMQNGSRFSKHPWTWNSNESFISLITMSLRLTQAQSRLLAIRYTRSASSKTPAKSIWDMPAPPLSSKPSSKPSERFSKATTVLSAPKKAPSSPSAAAPSTPGADEDEESVVRSFHSVRLPSAATSALKPRRAEAQRSTRVTLMGTPNAGKSMLMNVLIGSKVSAVSPKSHTTRLNTVGVLTEVSFCFSILLWSGSQNVSRCCLVSGRYASRIL